MADAAVVLQQSVATLEAQLGESNRALLEAKRLLAEADSHDGM